MYATQILFTACSLVALCACFYALTRHERYVEQGRKAWDHCEAAWMRLQQERDRVTVLERDVKALRLELRKLAGRFYAAQREIPDDDKQPAEMTNINAPHCDNYTEAQNLGPSSLAAACSCSFCDAMRERKRRARDTMIPKTARGQGELAKLNAGKP